MKRGVFGPYWRDVEGARQWRDFDWSPGRRPHFTTVLVVDDPERPPIEALEAAKAIESFGASVRFERPGSILIFYGKPKLD